MDDASSDGQVICRMFGGFQPCADEEACAKKKDAVKGSAYPHTVGKSYAPVKQVVQHDGMYNRSKRGTRGDEAHCKRTTLAEIVRYYCYGRDVHNPLSQSEANPLGKKDLSIRVG